MSSYNDLQIAVDQYDATNEALTQAAADAIAQASSSADRADLAATSAEKIASGQLIDDTLASLYMLWSSEKVQAEIDDLTSRDAELQDQINTIDDTQASPYMLWSSEKVQAEIDDLTSRDAELQDQINTKATINATSTVTSKMLANGERCFVTAPTQTMTLPTSPDVNAIVSIGVQAFEDTVIARNGSNIMGLAEDLTIDKANAVVTLLYVNATEGWRIV